MASLAKLTIVGNLGREAETRYTPNGALTVGFSVAVNVRSGNTDSVNWYKVSCWGKLAETLDGLHQQHGALAKGTGVTVIGRLVAREYADQQGQTRTSLDVNADDVVLHGPGRSASPATGNGGGSGEMDDLPF